MRLYYIANARMPNEKGHGIQIAEMCDAFIKAGVDLTLVVPERSVTQEDMKTFYALQQPVPLVQLWIPKLFVFGKFGFFMSSLFFMMCYSFFLVGRRMRGERFFIYTIDMDGFSSTLLPFFGPCVTEMHTPKKMSLAQKIFFSRLRGVIATTTLTRDSLVKTFSFPHKNCIVEPNGVDVGRFAAPLSKENARRRLSLPLSSKFAFYVGRFYEWKGLDILPAACRELLSKDIECYVVGGTEQQFKEVTSENIPDNLHIMGAKSPTETPLWLAACDTALVLGTARNDASFRFTSPMKLFEYMAARVPIVASDTPALQDVLTTQETFFYEHDNAASLAEKIIESINNTEETTLHIERAYTKVQHHTLQARAARILDFIEAVK